MLKKYILGLVFILFIVPSIYSSDKNIWKENNLQLEARLHYGFLLSHHLELERFNSHFPAFEISFQKATYGKYRWEKEYDYPLVGVSLWVSDMGGFEEIGNAYAIFPFINFPLFRQKIGTLNFRTGLGLGYLGNVFNNKTNYKNFAIGSHFNITANLQLEYRFIISKRLTLSSGITLTHFSNGSLKTPNYGLNIFTGNISLTYFLSQSKRYGGRMLLPELFPYEFDGRRYLEFNVSFAISNKDMTQSVGERFMVYALNANLMKRVSYKSKFGIGIDLTSDLSDKYYMELNPDPENPASTYSYIKPGVNVAYELVISRMSVLANVGLYLGGRVRKRGDAYQRFTIKYLLRENLFGHITLSTHAGAADYVGIGLGYHLNFIYRRKIK